MALVLVPPITPHATIRQLRITLQSHWQSMMDLKPTPRTRSSASPSIYQELPHHGSLVGCAYQLIIALDLDLFCDKNKFAAISNYFSVFWTKNISPKKIKSVVFSCCRQVLIKSTYSSSQVTSLALILPSEVEVQFTHFF